MNLSTRRSAGRAEGKRKKKATPHHTTLACRNSDTCACSALAMRIFPARQTDRGLQKDRSEARGLGNASNNTTADTRLVINSSTQNKHHKHAFVVEKYE